MTTVSLCDNPPIAIKTLYLEIILKFYNFLFIFKDDGSDSPSHYFNIYYPWEKDADFNLDRDSREYSVCDSYKFFSFVNGQIKQM